MMETLEAPALTSDLEAVKDDFLNGHLKYRANITIDCTIFGYHDGVFQLLLVNNAIFTKWCLPGGHIKKTESLDAAATRISVERAGIDNLFLKQFKTFSDPGRHLTQSYDPDKLFALTGFRVDGNSWLAGETVTVGYYAITDVILARPTADFLSSECRWFPVDALPPLGFDHEEIVREALAAMRLDLYHFPVGKSLLPELFTLKEIKLFYETMSGKTLHISNFPNKLIAMGLIRKTNEKRKIGAHRSPTYYRFDDETYNKALEEGLVFV